MNAVFVGAAEDVLCCDGNRVDTSTGRFQLMNAVQCVQVPHLNEVTQHNSAHRCSNSWTASSDEHTEAINLSINSSTTPATSYLADIGCMPNRAEQSLAKSTVKGMSFLVTDFIVYEQIFFSSSSTRQGGWRGSTVWNMHRILMEEKHTMKHGTKITHNNTKVKLTTWHCLIVSQS